MEAAFLEKRENYTFPVIGIKHGPMAGSANAVKLRITQLSRGRDSGLRAAALQELEGRAVPCRAQSYDLPANPTVQTTH